MRRGLAVVVALLLLLLLLVVWRRIEGIVRRVLVVRRVGVGRSISSRVGWPRMGAILMLPGQAREERLIDFSKQRGCTSPRASRRVHSLMSMSIPDMVCTASMSPTSVMAVATAVAIAAARVVARVVAM